MQEWPEAHQHTGQLCPLAPALPGHKAARPTPHPAISEFVLALPGSRNASTPFSTVRAVPRIQGEFLIIT